jgi:superfamily II DNA or RNA helicase
VYQVERTDSLIAQGRLSALRVRCVVLEYPEHERKTAGRDYQDELDFITSHQRRNELIRDLALTLKGNTLILYAWVDKHGKPIYELIKRAAPPGRKVFFIHGGTAASDREEIRHIVEKEKDAIIVASYGVFSTGVNIRNLHNAVAASPSKSVVRVLQSIGRILRLGDDKEYATWYDFADDITWKSKTNHTLKHFGERMRIYDEQNFDVKVFRRKV